MTDFCELNSIDFENSKIKNTFIASTDGEWIWFVDSSVTGREDIEPVLGENAFLSEYDGILFCSEELDGEVGLLDLLANPQIVVYAFGVRRKLLVKVGAFNQFLEVGNNYEFLLRAASAGSMYAISCSAEKELEISVTVLAYIVRKYMVQLKECKKLDEIFMLFVNLAKRVGFAEEFNGMMNLFLADITEFEKIEKDTAPCLVLVGDEDTCAGVLSGFAKALADELVLLGQAVITTDERYGNYSEIPTDTLLGQTYKAIIGFQSPALLKEYWQKTKGKKIQFLLDNPIFFDEFLNVDFKCNYFLCQDAYYADFIKTYYNIPNALQFPPGGTVVKNLPCEKIYDVVFVGNYELLPEGIYEDEFEQGFFDYMKEHPDSTFEQGLSAYGKERGIEYSTDELLQQLHKLKNVCLDVLHRDRYCIMETILASGIQVHVYSENWKQYQGMGKENLIIHSEIYGEEPFRVWSQAKIGLNMMRGHKAGMTERIANIMLCGACCVSEETIYLKEHFTAGEDIVLFERNRLYELPDKIRYLLSHDEERERIAIAGREKAFKEHTWRKRAQQLLEILDL